MEVLIRRIDLVVTHVLRAVTAGRYRTAIRPLEEPAVTIVLLDAEAALVHQPVMRSATRVSARTLE